MAFRVIFLQNNGEFLPDMILSKEKSELTHVNLMSILPIVWDVWDDDPVQLLIPIED